MSILGKRLLVWMAPAVLTACTVFPSPEAPRVMDLAQVESIPAMDNQFDHTLRVDTPLASEPVSSTRILTKPTPLEFQTYASARWRDSAPVIVRDHLVATLRKGNLFVNVVTETSPATTDLTFISELSAFQAEQRGAGMTVVIELHAQVLDNRSRASLCVRDNRIERSADNNSLDAVVRAFSDAAGQLSENTLVWLNSCLGKQGH